jgi:hypothetical protein
MFDFDVIAGPSFPARPAKGINLSGAKLSEAPTGNSFEDDSLHSANAGGSAAKSLLPRQGKIDSGPDEQSPNRIGQTSGRD